ncbi:MAG: LuxR C-terminal-related transcriptional regulator [Thermomicrobiales bacterium]
MSSTLRAQPSQPAPLCSLPGTDRGANLPAPLSSLIGREAEIAAACALLAREDVRLVTFTGPGGVGKTQLALAVARQLSDVFADGAVFVPLAPLTDPALVTPAIAQVLGVRDSGTRPLLDGLRIALRERELLLLLDNFEHVLTAASVVVDLLTACPRLNILVTSRALLHLTGEQSFPVPPLRLPDPATPPSVEALAQTDATRLFVTRAQESQPDFALSAANADAVAAICHSLDGLPLAIELAATRMRVLSPPAMLAQLTNRLPLLTGGHRNAPARQQTMRQTIAWSYDLLPSEQQILFRRLAVFIGGFSLDGAQAVGANQSVLDDLAGLVDQSLVRQVTLPNGELRFSMLETIREYGLEQLAATNEETAARNAHARYLLELTAEAEPQFWPPRERPRMLDRYEIEHPNVRAALDWLDSTEQVEHALQLICRQRFAWEMRGHLAEAWIWLDRLLLRGNDVAPVVQRRALTEAAGVAIRKGNLDRAQHLCEEALPMVRASGDWCCESEVLDWMGDIAGRRGDDNLATARYEEALKICTDAAPTLNDESPVEPLRENPAQRLERFNRGMSAKLLLKLAWQARQRGDANQARLNVETAFVISKQIDDLGMVCWAQAMLSVLAWDEGDLARADELMTGVVTGYRSLGFAPGIAINSKPMGDIILARGEPRRAIAVYQESLDLFWNDGDPVGSIVALEGLAYTALALDRPEQALRLFAAASATREALGASMPEGELCRLNQALAEAGAKLGDETFRMTWDSGRLMPIEDAVAAALAFTVEPAHPAVRGDNSPLTMRELGVLRLLVEGHSDKEIAEALGMSRRTASKHVEAILSKLNVSSRTGAATYATRQGLV